MFVDASAIVAILTREPEAEELADALGEARSPITSPIAMFEAVLGISCKRRGSAAKPVPGARAGMPPRIAKPKAS